jgi:hypothetical protein
MLNSLQGQRRMRAMLNRARQQPGQFSARISQQLGSLRGAARTRATRPIKDIQEHLATLGERVSLGVEKVGTRLKHGWKVGRSFTLGIAAGALWAMLLTPQSGATTRQRLAQPFQALRRKH